MHNPNDPIGKMGELMAKLFAIVANEVIEEFGEEKGHEVIKRGVWKFGVMRGQQIREKVLESGNELSLESFSNFSDLPPSDAWDATTDISGNVLKEYTRYCPYSKAWKEIGLENVGKLYCYQDEAMAAGFFDNATFAHTKLFVDNAAGHCESVIEITRKEGQNG